MERSRELSYDDLAYHIICLELELEGLKSDIEEDRFNQFKQMISIYELEKQNRLNEVYKPKDIHTYIKETMFDDDIGY